MLPYIFLAKKLYNKAKSSPAGGIGNRFQTASAATTPGPTPYLGLAARLSQAWINKWTVLLLLVLARMVIATISLHNDINDAKVKALSACSEVENVGSTLASMPHYLAGGVNELTASGVDRAVAGLHDMLLLSVTGAEEVVVFGINLLTSTYMCLITLAVGGSLHVAIDLVEDVSGFLNSTVKELGSEFANGVEDFENAMAKAFAVLVKLGAPVTPLDLNGTIDKLEGLQLPSGLYTDLTSLNNSIPDFKQAQNLTDNAIRLPFEEVKKLMNQSMGTFQFNRSLLHVPKKESLSFCSDNNEIENFFKDLIVVTDTAKQIAIIVLCILAILACVPMAYREYRSYNIQRKRSQLISANSYDNMDVVYIVQRPYTSTAGMKLASKVSSTKRQTLIRWVIAYITTVPALFVLSLGIAGLFSCLCQYIMLRSLEKEVPHLVNEVVGFEEKVIGALTNSSNLWANTTNTAILNLNNDLNHDLFGWVNTSTTALNSTLNLFVDETTKVLNETFGGTVLYQPITGVFDCLIELKIAGIQKALTWVHDNAHISFPLLPNDTFSAGAQSAVGNSTGGASNLLANAQSSAGDSITSAVASFTQRLRDGILTEVKISLVIIGIWVIILLMALSRVAFLWFDKDDDTPTSNTNDGYNGGDDGGDKGAIQMNTLPPSFNPFADPSSSHFPEKSPVFSTGYCLPPPTSPTRSRFTQAAPIASTLHKSPSSSSDGSTAVDDIDAGHFEQVNTYRGVPYTLTPLAMPMPVAQENMGVVPKRSGDFVQPRIARTSSYGEVRGFGFEDRELPRGLMVGRGDERASGFRLE